MSKPTNQIMLVGTANMNISQDTFNKIITLGLFIYTCTIFLISFLTGKAVDWQTLFVFVLPTLTHLAGQITNTQVVTKNIDAATQQSVAQVTASSNANGKSTS